MKAYLAIKYHQNQENREAIERISAALAHHGLETVCVVRDLELWGEVCFTAVELMQKSFTALETSDVIIVELTEKGVGVGIEAGYAAAKGIPIITIASAGADISDTLQGISHAVLSYAHVDDLPALLAHPLAALGLINA
ncbi:MAG: nucleoside 2-deoxyribosyltransferase [Anaerolineales bacterium]|nr:nucleoside 2-deoxyribosyltransferase [Anaerolineales bacterium]